MAEWNRLSHGRGTVFRLCHLPRREGDELEQTSRIVTASSSRSRQLLDHAGDVQQCEFHSCVFLIPPTCWQ